MNIGINTKDKYSLNEYLLKSFDNIMQQQNKMDNKAYIFIGFLIFIFNISKDCQHLMYYSNLILLVLAIPLICSLIPIATTLGIKIIKLFKNEDRKNEHNIFYYIDICHMNKDDFVKALENEYDVKSLSLADKKLIEQIIVNAEILNAKVIGHSIFLWILLFTFIAFTVKFFVI